MNPVFGSRKRADEFDVLLSRSLAGRPVADDAAVERYGDLLELVTTMRGTALVEPRADFSSDLRSRLMLAAESELAADPDRAVSTAARPAPAVRRSAGERRLVAAVGGFAIVSATASMSVAAQSALPGDTLYPLKRAIENAQTGVQRDADTKAASLLGNATGRLDEVGALSRTGDDDDDARVIATTLDDFVTQASEASDLLLGDYSNNGDAASIEELRSFTADSMGALTSLQTVIPDGARASLIKATQAINAIDFQAQSLCPACTDLPILQVPVFAAKSIDTLLDDALGPVLAPILAPSAGASDTGKAGKKGSKGKGAKEPGASGPADAAPTTPAAPSTPTAPALPPESGDKDGKGGKKNGGLLDNLNVNGSDDPIGDLLTGTGEVVDEVVEGVTDGLGDLGDNLNSNLGNLGLGGR